MKSKKIVQILLLLTFGIASAGHAAISVTVNGLSNGASIVQGSAFTWNISGLVTGASVTNELWVDKNNNGVIDVGTDFVVVQFQQQDGVVSTNDNPGDDDATANGTILTTLTGIYFPVSYYVIRVKSGAESATSAYQVTAMTGTTFSINGRVMQAGAGKANVLVAVETPYDGQFYALTNATGYYTINTNLAAGTMINIRVPLDNFNVSLVKIIASPNEVQHNLFTNLYSVDFRLRTAKIVTGLVTDTLNNPIASMDVQIYQNGGGNSYNGTTDANGRYNIPVDTGTYIVQFGNENNLKGYLKTYYNQKYIGWMTTLVTIGQFADTVRNINAVLKRGGVITGTFIKDGLPVRGNIIVYDYNNPNVPLYEAWHEAYNPNYYLVVPPGQYSVQFNLEYGQSKCYYNQTVISPGTAVTVASFSDTVRNINVNFSTIPKVYTFNGWGDWYAPTNWEYNQMPPAVLPSGDYIFIKGGSTSIFNGSVTIANGAHLIIENGANLQVNGNLIRQ